MIAQELGSSKQTALAGGENKLLPFTESQAAE